MVGVGLIGFISKLHQWDEGAIYFDGGSLGQSRRIVLSQLCMFRPQLSSRIYVWSRGLPHSNHQFGQFPISYSILNRFRRLRACNLATIQGYNLLLQNICGLCRSGLVFIFIWS
jgi:hypothetical protein